MNRAVELVAQATDRGATLYLNERGRPAFDGRLPRSLVDELREHRDQVRDILLAEPGGKDDEDSDGRVLLDGIRQHLGRLETLAREIAAEPHLPPWTVANEDPSLWPRPAREMLARRAETIRLSLKVSPAEAERRAVLMVRCAVQGPES